MSGETGGRKRTGGKSPEIRLAAAARKPGKKGKKERNNFEGNKDGDVFNARRGMS